MVEEGKLCGRTCGEGSFGAYNLILFSFGLHLNFTSASSQLRLDMSSTFHPTSARYEQYTADPTMKHSNVMATKEEYVFDSSLTLDLNAFISAFCLIHHQHIKCSFAFDTRLPTCSVYTSAPSTVYRLITPNSSSSSEPHYLEDAPS